MRKNTRFVTTVVGGTALAAVAFLGVQTAGAATQPGAPTTAAGKEARSAVTSNGGLSLRYRAVPTSSLPAAARGAVRGVVPNSAANIYVAEIISYQYGKCVDANNYGPTAGRDGDVVQLWSCFHDYVGHPNQWWIPVQTTRGWTELVSLQYGKCLDADNSRGFVDGARVQLWTCFHDSANHANQWWNYGPPSQATSLPSLWGGGSKVLDVNNAGPTAGQNGDKIQLWGWWGGANQRWYQ